MKKIYLIDNGDTFEGTEKQLLDIFGVTPDQLDGFCDNLGGSTWRVEERNVAMSHKEMEQQRKEAEQHIVLLRDTIEREVDYVDEKPYSHNIISISLQGIAKYGGPKAANQAIDDFGLEDLGWYKVGPIEE